MTPFLKLVSDDLLAKTGGDLSRTVVVFPGKRAKLFMDNYLAESGRPLWSPRYMTVSELFDSLSPYDVNDPIDTVCRLYGHYVRIVGASESLDRFYGWGERLLADFDDIDKNLIDARRLLRNLKDIKELDRLDYIDSAQERELQRFFHGFSVEKNSELRERFLELWDKMHDIYTALREELFAEGLAYEGAQFRQVAEALESGRVVLPEDAERYAFVGFNVLSRAEKSLMAELRRRDKAWFYWDYDIFYTREGAPFEAGAFVRENMRLFPGELPATVFDNFRRIASVEFVSVSTDSAGAASVGPWVEQHVSEEKARETAVVMCDETLLQPILHALPSDGAAATVNVTKGFPLHYTKAYATFCEWIDRAERSAVAASESPAEMLRCLSGKVVSLAEELDAAAPPPESPTDSPEAFFATLEAEACYRLYLLLERFVRMVESGRLDVSPATLRALLDNAARSSSIPYEGEPVDGLQVMGVLETRCLDFENVLMLGVNEGKMPARASDTSFIPYMLRKEFGMTTPRQKTAVYAYYFYRLLQRASHVRLVYSTGSDGIGRGERSRYMTQLLVEGGLPQIKHLTLNPAVSLDVPPETVVPKPGDLFERIGGRLSPSALADYLMCPVFFYFRHVARLREPQPVMLEVQPNAFGTLFHAAAQAFYDERIAGGDGVVTAEMLAPFADKTQTAYADALLAKYIRKGLLQARAEAEKRGGLELLPERIDAYTDAALRLYLRALFCFDRTMAPFKIVANERHVSLPLEIGGRTLELHGYIDRLDVVRLEERPTLRVVDYKTGKYEARALELGSLDDVFTYEKHYALQTFVYSLIMCAESDTQLPVAPVLFYTAGAHDTKFRPYINMGGEELYDFRPLREAFRDRLAALAAEILDTGRPFAPSPDAPCANCRLQVICKK